MNFHNFLICLLRGHLDYGGGGVFPMTLKNYATGEAIVSNHYCPRCHLVWWSEPEEKTESEPAQESNPSVPPMPEPLKHPGAVRTG